MGSEKMDQILKILFVADYLDLSPPRQTDYLVS